jgi:predicted AlkP superfamily phosphohydrolase/phosphomutase
MSKSLGKTACGQYLLKSSFQDPLPYAIDKQVKNAIPVMMNAIHNLSCGILRGVQTPPATFQAHLALCQLNQGVLSLYWGQDGSSDRSYHSAFWNVRTTILARNNSL